MSRQAIAETVARNSGIGRDTASRGDIQLSGNAFLSSFYLVSRKSEKGKSIANRERQTIV